MGIARLTYYDAAPAPAGADTPAAVIRSISSIISSPTSR